MKDEIRYGFKMGGGLGISAAAVPRVNHQFRSVGELHRTEGIPAKPAHPRVSLFAAE